MTASSAISEKASLSVLLFHAAMMGDKSISDFAEQLDIGAISLRQFIEGNTQRPRTKTLELIGNALDMPLEEVRRHMGYSPEAAPPFGEWLERHMKEAGYSRAKLTRDTEISDGALRNYLSNKTRPDSDQAMRIAQVLQADPFEVAQVVVASTVAEKGGTLAEAEPPEAFNGVTMASIGGDSQDEGQGAEMGMGGLSSTGPDERALVSLWRQLHPQGRRASLSYIAMLLAER